VNGLSIVTRHQRRKWEIFSEPCRESKRQVLQDDVVPRLVLTYLKGMNMTTKTSTPPARPIPMTAVAAARIQGATAKANGGAVTKGSFAARAQSAAAKGGKR
jgi:hypothetical protein